MRVHRREQPQRCVLRRRDLVWSEPYHRMEDAMAREKQIKSGSRKDKLALIERDNLQWRDLCESLNA